MKAAAGRCANVRLSQTRMTVCWTMNGVKVAKSRHTAATIASIGNYVHSHNWMRKMKNTVLAVLTLRLMIRALLAATEGSVCSVGGLAWVRCV